MPDYTFYCDCYLGEDIPEADFPRMIQRAAQQLAHWKSVFQVTPRPGLVDAEEHALCAVADAMYEFAQEDEARGLSKLSVGSVSETYVAPPELCATTLSLREAHYRREAGYYLTIGRWCL